MRFAGSQTTRWDVLKKTYVPEPGTTLLHEGYGGASVAALTAKVEAGLLAPLALTDRDVVVLLPGGNDGSLSPVELKDRIGALVRAVGEKTKAHVLLADAPIFLPNEVQASALAAKEYREWIYPRQRIALGRLGRFFAASSVSEVTSDGTHPNDEGYRRLGEDLGDALEAAFVPPLPPDARVVPLGDSIIVGAMGSHHGFRETLARRLGIPLVSSGSSDPGGATGGATGTVTHEGIAGLPTPFRWRSLPSGATLLDPSSPGPGGGKPILLVLPKAEGNAFYDAVVRPWRPLAEKYGARSRVPPAEILGTIYGESGGDPRARSSVGAVGLMQLYDPSLKKGHTDAELEDPDLNVEIGAGALAQIRARSDVRGDVPRATASYNLGHVERPEEHGCKAFDLPWDLCAAPGYVSRVVMATNTFLHREGKVGSASAPGSSAPAPARQSGASSPALVVATVGVAFVAGRALLRVVQRR